MPRERDFYKISLKIFLKNKQGEFLLLKCREDGVFAGFWDVPGGGIERDEFNIPFDEIIRREVAEEIGDVNYSLNLKPVGIGRFENAKKESPLGGPMHGMCIFFEAIYKNGEVKISDEHIGFQWVKLTKDNLGQYFKLAVLDGFKTYLENLNNEDNHKS